MKRSFYAIILLIFVLVCCTVTSTWVEQQMMLTGRITKGGKDSEIRDVQLPLWKAWHSGLEYHMFQVVTETDSNGAVNDVVREISNRDFSVFLDFEMPPDGAVTTYAHGESRFLHAASRMPTDGEKVEIPKVETRESQVLVWDPAQAWMTDPTNGNAEILDEAEFARLLRVTQNTPFLEKEQLHSLYAKDHCWESLRAIDLTDVRTLLENFPYVWAAALCLLVGLFFLLWAWIRNRRWLLLPVLPVPVCVWLLLRHCNLPASLLPSTSIFDFAHYSSVFNSLWQTGLASQVRSILQDCLQQTKNQCILLTVGAAALTLLPALISGYRTCKQKAQLQANKS